MITVCSVRPPELGGSGACCNRDVWLLSWFRTRWRLGRSTAAMDAPLLSSRAMDPALHIPIRHLLGTQPSLQLDRQSISEGLVAMLCAKAQSHRTDGESLDSF